MTSLARAVFIILIAISFQFSAMSSADAKCTRLAFSVNDYGKDGPTEDAKKLLDGYIAKWTAERNISGYKIGKKTVDCELFLDFIVFDEYTCKAHASVCWGEETAEPKLRPAQATEPASKPVKPAQTAQTNVTRKKRPSAPRPQGGYNSVFEAN